MGEIDHARAHHVFAGLVREIGLQPLAQFAGFDLAEMLRQREHLVTGIFDRAGLVAVDVPRHGREHALVAAQERGDHDLVGLCAADEKAHRRLRRAAGLTDLFRCAQAVFVLAVAGLGIEVRPRQRLQQLRMRAGVVVAFKGKHAVSSAQYSKVCGSSSESL